LDASYSDILDEEWCISMNKVEAVITDSRSDMITAIRQQYFAGKGDDQDAEDNENDIDSLNKSNDADPVPNSDEEKSSNMRLHCGKCLS